MFVYQNKDGNICVTFQDNKPVETAEYVFAVDKNENSISVNGEQLPCVEVTYLTEDIVNPTATKITSDVSIDLAGHTISIPEDTDGSGVFCVLPGGNLTIAGDGVINGVGKNNFNMAIWADGGKVLIKGGFFTNKGATDSDGIPHFDLLYVKNGGVIEIEGGTFECETPQWTLNSSDNSPGKFIVRGGTFIGYNPADSKTEMPGVPNNFVAEGYKVVQHGNKYTVVRDL